MMKKSQTFIKREDIEKVSRQEKANQPVLAEKNADQESADSAVFTVNLHHPTPHLKGSRVTGPSTGILINAQQVAFQENESIRQTNKNTDLQCLLIIMKQIHYGQFQVTNVRSLGADIRKNVHSVSTDDTIPK